MRRSLCTRRVRCARQCRSFSTRLAEPLPMRNDGTFETRAEVAAYTEVGVLASVGSHAWRSAATSDSAPSHEAAWATAAFGHPRRQGRHSGATWTRSRSGALAELREDRSDDAVAAGTPEREECAGPLLRRGVRLVAELRFRAVQASLHGWLGEAEGLCGLGCTQAFDFTEHEDGAIGRASRAPDPRGHPPNDPRPCRGPMRLIEFF